MLLQTVPFLIIAAVLFRLQSHACAAVSVHSLVPPLGPPPTHALVHVCSVRMTVGKLSCGVFAAS